jgi:hypothetical protein
MPHGVKEALPRGPPYVHVVGAISCTVGPFPIFLAKESDINSRWCHDFLPFYDYLTWDTWMLVLFMSSSDRKDGFVSSKLA